MTSEVHVNMFVPTQFHANRHNRFAV